MAYLTFRPVVFQSTPPARGATAISDFCNAVHGFQSTPPARGATKNFQVTFTHFLYFNPRPPRGGRLRCHCRGRKRRNFNPRPPRGGRLKTIYQTSGQPYISIHAPREGGDEIYPTFMMTLISFQSTPPARGATASIISFHRLYRRFQSTPPARGATQYIY